MWECLMHQPGSLVDTISEFRGWSPFTGLQIMSLIERTPERELLPMARTLDIGITAWSPLGEKRFEINNPMTASKQINLMIAKDLKIAKETNRHQIGPELLDKASKRERRHRPLLELRTQDQIEGQSWFS